MLVKNPNKNIIAVPLRATDEVKKLVREFEPGKKDENDRPIVKPDLRKNGSAIILNTGWNEIPREVWPLCDKTVLRIADRGLVELKWVIKKGDVKIDATLDECRADQALSIVKECNNPIDLERWSKDSSLTPDLRAEASMQLDKIQNYEFKG